MPKEDADFLEAAKKAYKADIQRLSELAEDQIDYLSRLDEVEDPLSYGLECDDEDHG